MDNEKKFETGELSDEELKIVVGGFEDPDNMDWYYAMYCALSDLLRLRLEKQSFPIGLNEKIREAQKYLTEKVSGIDHMVWRLFPELEQASAIDPVYGEYLKRFKELIGEMPDRLKKKFY